MQANLFKHLEDIAKKGGGKVIRLRGSGNSRDLKIDNLNVFMIDLKQILRSVEELSFVKTLSQLEQTKVCFFCFVFLSLPYLHSEEKHRYM